MILDIATLNVIAGKEVAFEAASRKASLIFANMDDSISHKLQRCIENPNQYVLLVNWDTLEDHTLGFRGSAQYEEWRALLYHSYDPIPVVEH